MQNIIIKNKIKAVIFDLDGTIIDSEPNYFLSDKKLLEEYNIKEYDKAFKNKYVGVGSKEMMMDIKKKYEIVDSIDLMMAKKDKYYLELAENNTKVFPEMKNFIEILKNYNIPMAIASGSTTYIINKMLKLTKLEKYFDVIISSQDVPKGKPEPDVFLEAAKKLGVSPDSCLVIEDSAPGIKAAKMASMYCIAVPEVAINLSDVFYSADLVFDTQKFSANDAYSWLISI